MAATMIYTAILTQKELDVFCSTFNISADLRSKFPGPNDTIKNSPEGNIRVYTRFIEFVNFRIPLSKFLLCVLEYYQINFSQLSVLAAAKISHFEIECRVRGSPPTVDDVVGLPILEPLNEGRAAIKKYLEVFLSVISLSRSFVDDYVRPTFMGRDGREMGLLDFVKSSDPSRVKTVERTLVENKVPLSRETEDMVISPSRETLRLIDHTITYELQSVASKRKRNVASNDDMPPPVKKVGSGQQDVGSGSANAAMEDFVSSSLLNSITRVNSLIPYVQTEAAWTGPVHDTRTSSTPGHEAGTSSSAPGGVSSVDEFYESQTIDSTTTHHIYVLNWDLTNDCQIDYVVMCRNFIDHILPPDYWVFIRNQTDSDFLNRLNANTTQNACMVSELRLRYEHEITIREKFETKFVKSVETIHQKNAEILETTAAAWAKELADLGAKNAKLSCQVFGMESLRDELKDQVLKLENNHRDLRGEIKGESKMRDEFMSIQDAEVQRIEGLEAGIEHGKAGRSLVKLEAYDYGVAAEYVVAVTELENVSFPLLNQVEDLKDSPLKLLMSSLTLKGNHAASHAHAEKRIKDASSSSDVETSLVAADYHISDVSIVKDVATSHELQNQIPTEETVHDDMFDTTLLDRPEDHHLSDPGSS
ncbi:hypothetical protein Tco_0184105 [Tanacetum coccineum]